MGVLTTALLAPLRYWREAVRCFLLCLIAGASALIFVSAPLSGPRDQAMDTVVRVASQSIPLAIAAAALGFAAAILLVVFAASAFVSWHRFLILGEEARWLRGVSIVRCLAYAITVIGTVLALLIPFVALALVLTLGFVSFTIDGLVAWVMAWIGRGSPGAANSIDVRFHDHLGLPHVAFLDPQLEAVALRLEILANTLAYGLAAALLYAGGLLLVRIAAGEEAPWRPPWFAVGLALCFLAYTIAWLPAMLGVELATAATSWDGGLAFVAPFACAVGLLAALFAVTFVAAVMSYLYAGDPWRYPAFYGLD